MTIHNRYLFTLSAILLVGAMVIGCGKSSDDAGYGIASTPEEAASQLETAFASSEEAKRLAAAAAAEALRKQEFETAVVSLQAVRASEAATIEEGLAVQSSMVVLEARLLSAMEAGDRNAARAYELLKALKRK